MPVAGSESGINRRVPHLLPASVCPLSLRTLPQEKWTKSRPTSFDLSVSRVVRGLSLPIAGSESGINHAYLINSPGRMLKRAFSLRARIYPCRKRRIIVAASAAEVTVRGARRLSSVCPLRCCDLGQEKCTKSRPISFDLSVSRGSTHAGRW